MNVKASLIDIVGVDNVSDNVERLKSYAKDHSLSKPMLPNYVVEPDNAEQIQEIVKIANKNHLPIVPCSSGVHFNGNTIPKQGGIMLDLQKMNKILNVDERNRVVRIEPGVTWGQLQEELEKYSAMALIPLLPHPSKSVLTSHLEREPMLIPKFEYSDALLTTEVILPKGELFRTGSACVPGYPENSVSDGVHPEGPGLDWWRLFMGAQGTMGIVTWANVKFEYKPKVNKVFLIPFKRIEDAVEPVYRIQKRMIGQECLLLNNVNLAAILAEKWPEDYEDMKNMLPPWMLILVLSGGPRRPESKIEYEEEALRLIATELAIPNLPTTIPGFPGIERSIPELLRNAYPKGINYWKHAYKGDSQDLFFITKMSRTTEFIKTINDVATRNTYPQGDLGYYIQPLERARACHFECNFYYNPNKAEDEDNISRLNSEVIKVLLNMEAFFSRPYGEIADFVYERTSDYTMILKKLKGWLDPNNIMSPGRICF